MTLSFDPKVTLLIWNVCSNIYIPYAMIASKMNIIGQKIKEVFEF